MSPSPVAALTAAIDRRVGRGADRPSLWSTSPGALLSHVAVIAFLILVVTGIPLLFTYEPSTDLVVYEGSSELYDGQELPAAFASVVHTSEDVPGGMLLRRIHSAASHLLLATALLHLWRIVATGASRRPRSFNHVVGIVLLHVALGALFTGAVLPFDIVTAASLRIGHATLSSIPVIGEQLSMLAWGGEVPIELPIARAYWLHVLVFPLVFVALAGLHLWSVHRRTPTSPPTHRDATTAHGVPLWPDMVRRLAVLGLAVTALLALSAALVPWSDLSLEGPVYPAEASNTLHPPWPLFFLSGGLRILPPVDLTILGINVSGVLVAGVLLPGLLVGALIVYPFVERWRLGDTAEHHVRQGVLAVPFRAGAMAGLATAFLILSFAATVDVIAHRLVVPVEVVVWAFRVGIILGPVLAGAAAVLAARRRLRATDEPPDDEHALEVSGPRGGTPTDQPGGYTRGDR